MMHAIRSHGQDIGTHLMVRMDGLVQTHELQCLGRVKSHLMRKVRSPVQGGVGADQLAACDTI